MDWQRTTEVIVAATAALLIAYDIFVAANKEKGDTISEVVRDRINYPVIPFALGAILGHWTALGWRLLDSGLTGLFILLAIGGIMGLWSRRVSDKNRPFKEAHNWLGDRPYVAAIAGYLLGALLWGMNPPTGM